MFAFVDGIQTAESRMILEVVKVEWPTELGWDSF